MKLRSLGSALVAAILLSVFATPRVEAQPRLRLRSPQEVRGEGAREGRGAATSEWTRYVEATVALACNAVELPSSEEDSAREAANASSLRRFGYTRASYAKDARRFAMDANAEAVIRSRAETCRGESGELKGSLYFKGKVKDGQSLGNVNITVTARDATGTIQLTLDGQNLSFTTGRHPVKGALIRMGGRFSRGGLAGTYVLIARWKGKRMAGRLRLVIDRARTVEIPLELSAE